MLLCLFINEKMPTIVGSLTFMSRKTKSYSGDLSMILITSEPDQESDMPTFLLLDLVTLKAPNKNCSRRQFKFLLLSFEENKA